MTASEAIRSDTYVPRPVAMRVFGIWKRFGKPWRRGEWILENVDLEILEGAVTALVGPNAAGKTTLMRVCMGFERPNSGRVEVFGVDPLRDRSSCLRRLGYVPQTPAVHRGLSVRDHLALARALRGSFDVSYARRRLEQLSIPLDKRADTLSGGQAAQLGLAIALGTRARLLVLDEPLANLDPLARREFIEVLLEAVRSEGTSVLLSSHIVTDIEEASDRLLILGAGKVLLDKTLTEARNEHRLTEGNKQIANASIVASFAGRQSKRLTLWHLSATNQVSARGGTGLERSEEVHLASQDASLEDIVLGYLAAGRGSANLPIR